MDVTRPKRDRSLAIAAVAVGAIEAGFAAVLGIMWFAPVFGVAAMLLGALALHRASLGGAATGLAAAAAVCAALGVIAAVAIVWFLSNLEFTF